MLLLVVVIVSYGCKTKKVIQDKGSIPDRSKTEILKALEDHNYDFDWYACVTSLSVNSPEIGVNAKGYIRMKKDSIIWGSFKKYKTEGVRTLVTPESYVAINRLDRTYQKGSTQDVFSSMGISLGFEDVQQAIFGNIIIPDSNDVSIEKQGDQYVVKSRDQDLQLKYWINAYDLELDEVKMVDYRGREIKVYYDDYREIESGEKVAFFRHYTVPSDQGEDGEIIMKIKEIEINVPKKTKFTINPRYERIH